MRLALVHPTYWPEVRRGSERFVHDLAAHLSGRGHDVTILTGHRGSRSRDTKDGVTVVRGRRPPPRLGRRADEPHANHAPLAFLEAARGRFDLVHALHIPDAWGISWLSRLTGQPLVLSLMGYPDAQSLDAFPRRRRMLARAARRASAVHALSDAAARALRDETGIEAAVIHPGTDTAAFEVDVLRDERPTIFCAASPADPRKRVGLLVEAFALLRRERPDARLLLDSGGRPPDPALIRDGVEVIDLGGEGLAERYARSWVTVLPSEREAFGLVLVESLAAGTPAVAIREGGVPEILDDERVGVIADAAEPARLAEALGHGLDLGRSEEARSACREHARRWDWEAVAPAFESLYRDALARRDR